MEANNLDHGERLPERLPPLPEDALSEAQRAAVQAFTAGRGYPPLGPFWVLARSPEVMLRAKALGDYLRYRNALPKAVSELAILVTARTWTQGFEFHHHAIFAREAGLGEAIIAALADGRRPDAMSAAEAAAYDFATELQVNKRVSDLTYARALAAFGEQGVVDLVGVQGYYTMLAMAMNVARTRLPDGVIDPLARFPE
jgi:4-carboxymuconolactone decarboxylase